MKKYITGVMLCLIMTLGFSLNVEAANKVSFNSEDNNYSVELSIDKKNVKLDEDDIGNYEEFYDIEINDKKDSYLIIKEYEDFIQIDPQGFTDEWNEIVKNLLGNENFNFTFNEEVVSFIYSGVRFFSIEIQGLTDELEFEINIPKEYISFFSDTSELGESESSSFDKINFKVNNDLNKFNIQTINYNNVKSAIISTDLAEDEIISTFEITYNENVPGDILSILGAMLNLSNISVDNGTNTVSFSVEYENSNHFSALHYRDMYNFLGVIAQIRIKDSGVYSKSKELTADFYDVGGMNNLQYKVTNSKGDVKITKGEAVDKKLGEIKVDFKENSSFEFETKKTNTYAIIVTLIVTLMFGILFTFAYLLYKKSR